MVVFKRLVLPASFHSYYHWINTLDLLKQICWDISPSVMLFASVTDLRRATVHKMSLKLSVIKSRVLSTLYEGFLGLCRTAGMEGYHPSVEYTEYSCCGLRKQQKRLLLFCCFLRPWSGVTSSDDMNAHDTLRQFTNPTHGKKVGLFPSRLICLSFHYWPCAAVSQCVVLTCIS